MSLIQRYLFRQLLGPAGWTLASLTAIAVLTQSLSIFDVIVEQRQNAWIFLKLTVLAMPPLITLIAPIALFVATLVVYNRLHTEHEIVVCFAAGLSRWTVIAPAMRLAVLAALAMLIANLFVQPLAAREARRTVFAVRTDLAAMLVRQGEFVSPAPGLTVYAQDVDPNGQMTNLFLHLAKPNGDATTFSSRKGHVTRHQGYPVLVMTDGANQELNRQQVLNYLKFDEYLFDLRPYLNTADKVRYKFSDRYLHELTFPDLRGKWERENQTKMLAEAHGRLANPLYAIAFVAMAVAAVLGGAFNRLGYGRRIAVISIGAAVLRIIGFGVQSACEDAAVLNVLQYAVPLGATAASFRILMPRKGGNVRRAVRNQGPRELAPLGA